MTGKRPEHPTERQLSVLDWIRRYVSEHGQAPTMREMERGLEVGRGSVQRYLEALEYHGRIRRGRGHRAMTLVSEER